MTAPDCVRHNSPSARMPAIPVETLAAGYKVVHMVPKGQVTTIPKYDEMKPQAESSRGISRPAMAHRC